MEAPESETLARKYDVFLSHRSQDKNLVRRLATRLQDEAELKPFFDEWELVPGAPLQEQLEGALAGSESCAVLIGPSGLSPWEHEEVRVVLEARVQKNRIRVIPVLLPGADEQTIEKLPPLLRRYLWVDFRAGIENKDALARLVAGIQGKPPGRGSSETIDRNSLFVRKSTNELMQQFLPFDMSQLQVDSVLPLASFAKLLQIHNPGTELAAIEDQLLKARSCVYDAKYAQREPSEDERYIDFRGWQTQLRQLLYDIGLRDFHRLDVVNVGIGNGNENPDFYAEFRSFTGVDTSQQSLERARLAMPFMKAVHGEAENLKAVESDSQDLYLSFRTYQSSFFNIADAAFEAARVTRHRGAAVISVPNVYVDKGKISKGLQRHGGSYLDPHFGWELADRVRRALHQAEFDAWITRGLFEIYIVGQK